MSLTVVSLGAGVQSSALLVMSALGLRGCPRADIAVFADTRDEPFWVYEQMWFLKSWGEAHGLPVHTVSRGRLSDSSIVRIPAFVASKDGSGPLSRNCTRDYKLTPIYRHLRSEMAARGAASAVSLQGISVEESHRMRDSRRKWIVNQYPLVDARMTRSACAALLEEYDLPVPRKSACVYCPWHSDAAWREIRDHDPDGWQTAIAYDVKLRERGAFLHRSLIPLADVTLGTTERSLFGNECEGVCGV